MPEIKYTCAVCGKTYELHFPVGGEYPNFRSLFEWTFCSTCYWDLRIDLEKIIDNKKINK